MLHRQGPEVRRSEGEAGHGEALKQSEAQQGLAGTLSVDSLIDPLIDGSLQFGDLRALLKVPNDAPSILDLPTDRVAESDLQDVLWRDPSGIDILLAPPRVEMAEMVTTRDIEKGLSILRKLYEFVIIDTRAALSEDVLVFLDAADEFFRACEENGKKIIFLAGGGDFAEIAVLSSFNAAGSKPLAVIDHHDRSGTCAGVPIVASLDLATALANDLQSLTKLKGEAMMARVGRNAWRGLYSLASVAGIVLMAPDFSSSSRPCVGLVNAVAGTTICGAFRRKIPNRQRSTMEIALPVRRGLTGAVSMNSRLGLAVRR